MSDSLSRADQEILEEIVHDLEMAWNRGDGVTFASRFTPDADFVNIQADHIRGREAIAAGHAAIFRTIYAGSTNHYTVETARLIAPEVALVHVRAVLDAPTGPLAGRHAALFSAVFVHQSAEWQIANFHNTLLPSSNAR